MRLQNFDEHIAEQRQKKRTEESRRQDLEDQLADSRKKHVEQVNAQGELVGEAKVTHLRYSLPAGR
jgi:DNA repair protein RAD50